MASRCINFLEKLIVISLPRVKDFRGVPRNGLMEKGTIVLA